MCSTIEDRDLELQHMSSDHVSVDRCRVPSGLYPGKVTLYSPSLRNTLCRRLSSAYKTDDGTLASGHRFICSSVRAGTHPATLCCQTRCSREKYRRSSQFVPRESCVSASLPGMKRVHASLALNGHLDGNFYPFDIHSRSSNTLRATDVWRGGTARPSSVPYDTHGKSTPYRREHHLVTQARPAASNYHRPRSLHDRFMHHTSDFDCSLRVWFLF